MKYIMTGRKMELTPGMKNAIEEKIGRLSKLFSEDAEVYVTVSVEKDRQRVEATVYSADLMIRAEETSRDFYSSLDQVVDALDRQVRKHKTRLEKRWKKAGIDITALEALEDIPTAADNDEFKIVKTKTFGYKPMSVEEAILQMNLLGHQFFVFNDEVTDGVRIVYKRRDNNYGLIEVK